MPTIKAQLAAAEARYRALQTRSRELDSKRETRRKILYGAALLNMLEQLPPTARTDLLARVHRHVTRDADRAALDLAPLPAPTRKEAARPSAKRGEPNDDDSGQGLLPM